MEPLRQDFPEIKEIHSSLHATIFEAIDTRTRKPIIIKISAQPGGDSFQNEISIYKYMQKREDTHKYSPKFLWTEQFEDGTRALALEALGPNLETIYELMDRRMPLRTLLILGDLMIECVRDLHMRGVLHCDIRPENFLIGRGKNSNDLHLIGFSKAKIVGENAGPELNKRFERRASFQSLSSQIGLSSSYRDDLESIGLMLVYFHEGVLPWQGILAEDDKTRFDLIANIKRKTKTENLCKNLPRNFLKFFNMCSQLKENEVPDYKKFRQLFRELLVLNNFQKGYPLNCSLIYEQDPNEKCQHALDLVGSVKDDGKVQLECPNGIVVLGFADNQNAERSVARTRSQILAEAILDSSNDDSKCFGNN